MSDQQSQTEQENALLRKDRSQLSYGERHAVRHLRNVRDKEYSKRAFKSCTQFADIYASCHAQYEWSAPFSCRSKLNDLKVCVNRHIVMMRQAEEEIKSLPIIEQEVKDYNDIIEEHLSKHSTSSATAPPAP